MMYAIEFLIFGGRCRSNKSIFYRTWFIIDLFIMNIFTFLNISKITYLII